MGEQSVVQSPEQSYKSKVSKQRVVVLFGGQSAEHEISCRSAVWVVAALAELNGHSLGVQSLEGHSLEGQSLDDKALNRQPVNTLASNAPTNGYEVLCVGITQCGQWVRASGAQDFFDAKCPAPKLFECEGEPISTEQVFQWCTTSGVVIPVLHGPNGEDGTIQGLLELNALAYVGSGVLGSSLSMDKAAAKSMLDARGIDQTKWCFEFASELSSVEQRSGFLSKCESEFGWPMFVKPANMGSSVGITKAHDGAEFFGALDLALSYDEIVVVEQGVVAREIEFAVLGNNDPIVSCGGEVFPGKEFYDFEDKYFSSVSKTQVPAVLDDGELEQAHLIVKNVYRTLRCEGLARVDMFYDDSCVAQQTAGAGRWLVNEVNTFPGCTTISMYPKMLEASGFTGSSIVQSWVDLALERRQRRAGRIGRAR